MSDIIDIIHKFSYITDKTGIEQALKAIQANSEAIGRSIIQANKLKAELASMGAQADKAYRDKIAKGIANAESAQIKYTNAIKDTIANNKKLQEEYLKETSLIGGLTLRMKELQDARFKSDNIKDIQFYNKEIIALQKSIRDLNSLGSQKLLIAPAQRTTNSNVLSSPATPSAIQSVREVGGGNIPQTVGLIQKLNAQISDLNKKKILAGSEAEIKAINKQLTSTTAELNKITNIGGKSNGGFGKIGQSILTGLGIGTGIQIFSTAFNKVTDFIEDASRMAAELEGVKVAFDRLNRPDLLAQLQVATKGTVSDLELMKKAVQYNNLGLPIDKLGTALEFVRRRSKETGVDINYLIKSLVDGIGRQSILKVDNLGISLQAVRKEVAKTGDFTTALFNIIEKGLQESGPELTTYAEKFGKINATIENNQAKLGDFFNFAKQGYIAFFEDIVTLGNGAEKSNTTLLGEALEARVQAQQDAYAAEAAQSLIFQNNYKSFLDKISSLDINGRNERLDNAQKFYDEDIRKAKEYYGSSIEDFNRYFTTQTRAFNLLRSQIESTPLNVLNVTSQNITSATKAQLEKAQSTLEGQKQDLPFGADVQDINRRLAIIRMQLSKFDPLAPVKEKIRKPKFSAEDFAKMRDEILSNYRKIIIDLNNEIENNPADQLVIPRLRREAETPFNVLQSDIDKGKQTPDLDLTAQLSLAEDIFAFEKKKREEAQAAEAQMLEERKQAYSDMYQSIVANASNAINAITQSQIDALDREIAYRQTTVEKGKELAERGNTEVLAQEEKALREATAAREAAAQRQIELNGILQASNMAVALSEAIGAIVSAASKGDPYTIAARVIAAVAALVGGVAALSSAFGAANQTGFAEGGYTGDGEKYQAAGVVHKGEFVFDKKTTARHRALFERIHAGDYPLLPKMNHETYMPQPSKYASYDKGMGDMKRELRDIKEAVLGLELNVNATQKTDINGFSQSVERTIKTNQRRFRS